jgi:hypothetical protein
VRWILLVSSCVFLEGPGGVCDAFECVDTVNYNRRTVPVLLLAYGWPGREVNVRVIPTGHAIEESLDLAHEIYNRVFRKVPERLEQK